MDARTGGPLAKVLVIVEGTDRSALTDTTGTFELTGVPAGGRRLYVSIIGYSLVQRGVEIAAGDRLEITIPLSEGTGTYTETVTVTAGPFRLPEPGTAAGQVLGSADLQNLRGVLADDPLRAVQALPGVATGDDLRSEFSVRGSDFAHMNLTVDGFSTPYLLHTVRAIEDRANTGSVAMINSDILEDVALLNGGYAQRFGNRTGAEIDFRLREGSRDRAQTRVAVSGTSASIVAEGPLSVSRHGSWLISARKSYLDLLIARLSEEGLNFGFSDAQVKLVHDVTSRHRVDVSVLAGRSRLDEGSEDENDPNVFVGTNASAVAIAGWRMTAARGVVAARVLAAANRFRNHETANPNLDTGRDRQLAARIDGIMTWSRRVQFEAGAQVEHSAESRRRQRATSSTTFRLVNDFRADGARSGAYARVHLTAGGVTVIPGARTDHWTLTGQTTASPWVQAEWRVAGSTSVRGGAGVYQQFADFEQVVGSFGRADMPPERAYQYDLAVEQRISSSSRVQVAVYDREERDFIRRPGAESRLAGGRLISGSSTAAYVSRLDGYARGVEVLVQRRQLNGLSGWVAYSFGRNRYRDVVSQETFWGDLDQRHGLNAYAFYRLSDRSSISAKLRVGSNFPAPGYYVERNGHYFLGEHRNDVRLPVYARVDVRANRTFNWSRKRLTLFGEVMNVLNRDNVRFYPPTVDRRTLEVTRMFDTLVPIVPSAGILIEF